MRMKLGLLLVLLCALAAVARPKDSPLTNDDIVKMVKSGQPEVAILTAIASHDTQFDVSQNGLTALSNAGVSGKVIRAMLAAEAKKKPAAAAPPPQENSDAATPPQDGGSPAQQMSQMGMPADMMSQMANLPPAARAQMEAAMARHPGPNARGSAPANAATSIPSRPGVPVPLDSPLYTSFLQLKTRPAYRVVMNMVSNDPRVAQMMAQGTLSPGELLVQGNTRQYVMHMKIPATDLPGTIDDWEIRSVVQNGRAARLITSPAVPRYLKMAAEQAALQLAMLDKQASMAIAHAAAEGPMGAVSAGLAAAQVAMAHLEVPRLLKKEKDFFSWKCMPAPKTDASGRQSTTQLTDLHPVGDQIVDGKAAAAYEFYAYDNEKTQGTARLFVAKDTGLPLRLEMGDANAGGALQMNYSELSTPANIEVPACMGAQ